LITKKANVCPFAIRLAWHASGTFDKDDKSPNHGGSDGATMRFEPESTDGANAGLSLMQDIIRPVKLKFPELSIADIWTLAGVQAIKLTGGPDIPYRLGRTDAPDNAACPPNGRLPDAALGAQHLRDVFHRMGLADKDIVALSGAHTLGSCHQLRSGYDGPWTHNPTRYVQSGRTASFHSLLHPLTHLFTRFDHYSFDNSYFKNLLDLEWKPRNWEGPLQYTDTASEKLMMLPSDLALIHDESFIKYVKLYAGDNERFFKDFAHAFSTLLALGTQLQPTASSVPLIAARSLDADFRDLAMHGSLERIKDVVAAGAIDINSTEQYSGRTALHKAAFFGHAHVAEYLCAKGASLNLQDADGDTALHDAARFGHAKVVQVLIAAGADTSVQNKEGKLATDLSAANGKTAVVQTQTQQEPSGEDLYLWLLKYAPLVALLLWWLLREPVEYLLS
jgi:hypothetical protein